MPTEQGKAKYMEDKILAINNIKKIKLENIEYDSSRHPSEAGTKEMIKQINTLVGNDLVLPERHDVTTTSKKYAQVQPMYKVGCRGCDHLEFTPQLCKTCVEGLINVDTSYLENIILGIREHMYPDIRVEDNNDQVMKTILKNSRENEDDTGIVSKRVRK